MWYHSHTKYTGWNNPKRKPITLLFHSLVWHKKKNIWCMCQGEGAPVVDSTA